MKLPTLRHGAKGVAFTLFALSLASCATDAPPPAAPPAPLPPTAPPVALAPEISDAASVYVAYVARARTISANFADGQTVQTDLQTGASYEPTQLARGAVAYAAIVAMQDPQFRAAVRAFGGDNAQRADMVQRLLSDPTYAGSLSGTDNAARMAVQALSGDGADVYKSGAAVKQAAYDVQHQNWSKEFVPGRDQRLAMAKQNSVTLKSVETDQSAKLLAAALTGQGLPNLPTGARALAPQAVDFNGGTLPAPTAPENVAGVASDYTRAELYNKPYTNAVNRALTIAAVAVLGEGPSHSASLVALLDDSDGTKCLNMSKLNLYQCLAVAKPYYEDVFCLGQHVLMDTGQCLGKMSSNALSFAPVRKIGFNDDGSVSHADAVPYLEKDKPVSKCKKGKKCPSAKASPKAGAAATTKAKPKATTAAKKKKA